MPASCSRATVSRSEARVPYGLVRGKEEERVVAPVIAEAPSDEMQFVDEGVDRQ